MEPLSAHSSTPAVLRPAHALQSDLAAVLREGKVLAGEVLQTMDGGTVLIGIGRHRVPAKTGAQFTVGQQLQLLVEAGEGGEPQLRLLNPEGGELRGLLGALRRLGGPPRSAVSGLSELSALLGVPGDGGPVEGKSPSEGIQARLVAALRRVLGTGIESGRALQARSSAVGRGFESSLLGRAISELPAESRARLAAGELESFRRLLLGNLRVGGGSDPSPQARSLPGAPPDPGVGSRVAEARTSPPHGSASTPAPAGPSAPPKGGAPGGASSELPRVVSGADPGVPATSSVPLDGARSTLQGAIERWLGQLGLAVPGADGVSGGVGAREGILDPRLVERLTQELPALLRRGLGAVSAGSVREQLLARLPHALSASAGRSVRGLLVQAFLDRVGVPSAARSPAGVGLEGELISMKLELLGALELLPEGDLRTAVEKALHGIESEQLLNQARREAGEPTHWTVPVPEGQDWREAHLFHEDRSKAGDEGSMGEAHRMTLSLELSGTGPVRADLWMGQGRVAIRVRAETEEVAQALEGRLQELEGAIADLGWPLNARIEVGSPEEVRVGERALDIAYLRDRRLLDLEG